MLYLHWHSFNGINSRDIEIRSGYLF